jgi:hypothetical protein
MCSNNLDREIFSALNVNTSVVKCNFGSHVPAFLTFVDLSRSKAWISEVFDCNSLSQICKVQKEHTSAKCSCHFPS